MTDNFARSLVAELFGELVEALTGGAWSSSSAEITGELVEAFTGGAWSSLSAEITGAASRPSAALVQAGAWRS